MHGRRRCRKARDLTDAVARHRDALLVSPPPEYTDSVAEVQ